MFNFINLFFFTQINLIVLNKNKKKKKKVMKILPKLLNGKISSKLKYSMYIKNK